MSYRNVVTINDAGIFLEIIRVNLAPLSFACPDCNSQLHDLEGGV